MRRVPAHAPRTRAEATLNPAPKAFSVARITPSMNLPATLRANSQKFRLDRLDPRYRGDLSRETAADLQGHQLVELQALQSRLYAERRNAVLVILQGMDASGKDGIVQHVMSGINPAGCDITSFKAPSPAELDHDYLWRCHQKTPPRGTIGIFNRSYYEEVLVVRVHPELLLPERLPRTSPAPSRLWKQRYRQIRDFERHLVENGTRVVKCFLHISAEEQLDRFLQRIDDPARNWKFDVNDERERRHWDAYQEAFNEMIRETSTKIAPWHVIPADRKWFARVAVAAILVETLQDIDPHFPEMDEVQRQALKDIRKRLSQTEPRSRRKQAHED